MVEKRSDRVEFLRPSDSIDMGIVDLSETGVAILHPNIEKSQAVSTIYINDLQLKAKLVYCKELVGAYKIGMQFQEVPADKKNELRRLVEKFSRGVSLTFKAEFTDSP